jgi:hypothetical protein
MTDGFDNDRALRRLRYARGLREGAPVEEPAVGDARDRFLSTGKVQDAGTLITELLKEQMRNGNDN